ncbi:MAG: hypothetical protein LBJ46_01950 [Planctomycetota bacterium]|jgi:hypothetical protein|nr:hypothetical protein [Planctomycetota bacterium]
MAVWHEIDPLDFDVNPFRAIGKEHYPGSDHHILYIAEVVRIFGKA